MTDVISEQFQRMSEDIRSLGTKLARSAINCAVVHQVPATPKGADSDPVSQIVLTEHTGRLAVDLAVKTYLDLAIRPNVSQKVARRSVGALWLPLHHNPAAHEIFDIVERINAAKSGIEQHIVQSYSTRQARFEALRLACPGAMTMHLYRHIRCFSGADVLSVRFSWQRKDSLVIPNKSELMQRIAEEMERARISSQLALNQLLMAVSNTPEDQLRLRRPVRVQPVANIRTELGSKTVTAPMPIILLQDDELTLKPLADFDASMQRKTRSDRSMSTVLGTFAGVTIEALSVGSS
jgi:DNA replication terminus site-binding protein